MAEQPITLDNGQTVIPDWAKEKTLNDMLEVIQTLAGVTKKTKEELEKIADETAKGNVQDGKEKDEVINAIQGLKEDKGGTKLFAQNKKSISLLTTAFKAGTATLGLFFTGMVAGYQAIKGLGDDIRGSKGGTGLDIAGPMGSAALFRTSMQTLGYSADEVTARFDNASQAIAIAGRDTFVTLTNEIQSITGAGSDYALTLAQMGDALDDDLKLRQAIGILNMLDGNKQAARSAELYAHQLKATTLLGKSIDEISGAGDDTLTSNASVQLLLQSMGEGAHEFTTQIQKTAGDLSASGLGQGVNNAIQNAMLESVAFRTDAGTDLFGALSALDSHAGTNLRGTIQQINELSKTNPDAAALMMDDFAAEMIGGAKSLTDPQLEALRPVIENMGELGKQFYISIGQMRQSKEVEADFSTLATSAATVDNALTKFRSSISGSMNSLMGAFGVPLSKVMMAFTETALTLDGVAISNEEYDKLTDERKKEVKGNSLFGVFNMQIKKISDAFLKLFGLTKDGGTKMEGFVKKLRTRIEPMIVGFGDAIANWVGEWTAESVGSTIDGIITGFNLLYESVSAVATVFGWFARLITATDTESDGEGGTKEVFNFKRSILYALTFAFGASVLKNAISGAFAPVMGGIASGVGSLVGKIKGLGGLAAQGTTAATAGKSFGKGAAGMLAFGAAMAGVGAAAAGLTYGMKTLGEMEWKDLTQGMVGLTMALIPFGIAIGLLAWAGTGPQAIGLWSIAGVLAAIGVAAAGIGVAAGGISMLVNAFGTTNEEDIAMQNATTDNVNKLAGIDKAQLDSTAAGITNIAKSMVEFGDATNDGWFSGPDLDDQEKQLGIFEKFAQLDGTKLTAFTDGMNKLIETIGRLNTLDTAVIVARADALAQLNEAASGPGFGERFSQAVADRLFGTPQPQVSVSSAAPPAAADANGNPAILPGNTGDPLYWLEQIAANTKTGPKETAKYTATKLAEVIS